MNCWEMQCQNAVQQGGDGQLFQIFFYTFENVIEKIPSDSVIPYCTMIEEYNTVKLTKLTTWHH